MFLFLFCSNYFPYLSNELIDRFGKLDDEIKYYMYEKLYQYLIKESDVVNVINNNTEITLVFSEAKTNTLDGNKIFMIANDISKDLKLKYSAKKISINFNKRHLENKNDYLIVMSKYLERIINSWFFCKIYYNKYCFWQNKRNLMTQSYRA